MLESIGFCLVIFMLLSLYLLWVFSKRGTDKNQLKITQLNSQLMEKNRVIKELEISYIEKRKQINTLVDNDIACRDRLLRITNLLRKKSDELYKVQEKLKEFRVKEQNIK